jgi:hypothetical protein
MNLRSFIAALALACLLTACSSGPVRKIHPSTASIQQLAVQPDGSWKITLRIENFSTMSMHYSAFSAKLSIAGTEAGELKIAPDLDIVGNSGDVVEATLKSAAKLPASGGTIDTSEPKANFKFDKSSRLSPVPGVANTYR